MLHITSEEHLCYCHKFVRLCRHTDSPQGLGTKCLLTYFKIKIEGEIGL